MLPAPPDAQVFLETWDRLESFVRSFRDDGVWDHWKAEMLLLVSKAKESGVAAHFRAGQSMQHLIFSTKSTTVSKTSHALPWPGSTKTSSRSPSATPIGGSPTPSRRRSYPAKRSTPYSFASSVDFGARPTQRSRCPIVSAQESVTRDETPPLNLSVLGASFAHKDFDRGPTHLCSL